MASKNVTFDLDAGVAKEVSLSMHTGADFATTFNINGTNNSAFNLTGYSGSAQMQKSSGIGATTVPTATFTVGITSAIGGKLRISLGSTATRDISEGRYMYNVLVSSGSTIYPLVNGNIMVIAGISSAP